MEVCRQCNYCLRVAPQLVVAARDAITTSACAFDLSLNVLTLVESLPVAHPLTLWPGNTQSTVCFCTQHLHPRHH